MFIAAIIALERNAPCITRHPTNTCLVSCTFVAQIKEVCHYNAKFSNLRSLNTEAHIDAIYSPQDKKIANYTEGLYINNEPLTVFPAWAQEDIIGQLDVQRANNTGDVSFQWASPQSGGHPIVTKWTEHKNSTDDLYGCAPQGWNRKEPPICSQEYPKVERVSITRFLFSGEENDSVGMIYSPWIIRR